MGKIQLVHRYADIISLENLLEAWKEFVRGKRGRKDVQEFESRLMDNVLTLHRHLSMKSYLHSSYEAFKISDPKPRDIHKASVRDRLVHHAIYRILYPFFDRTFIADSYSCRIGKGVHRALNQFQSFGRKVSHNHTKTVWVLKCDVRKFFASIDHCVLLEILRGYIPDEDILWLLGEIIGSFSSTRAGVGLPLGNLTSQLLVNIYMNEFDQFAKHQLKVRYYIRYADDFVVFSQDRDWLEMILGKMKEFLRERLKLELHPDKVSIATLASGVDFLWWVHFPDHLVLRTVTKRRMLRNIREKEGKKETVRSYLGLLSHGNSHKITESIIRNISSGIFE
ncbi:MAG: reverse transcriptase domain-containing protein [Candidatus Moraniibacteriota bacterium]